MDTETNSSTLSNIQPIQEEPLPSDTPTLQTPATRARFVYISFILLALMLVLSFIRDYNLLSIFLMTDTEEIDTTLVDFFDSFSIHLLVAGVLFAIFPVISFLFWAHRVAKNTLTMMPGHHYFSTPARYIWTYFIPIIGIYKPYLGMKDIFKTTGNTNTVQNTTKAGIVTLWWILFLVNYFISNLSNRMDKRLARMNEDDVAPEMWINNLQLSIASEIIAIVSIIVTVWMVSKITRGQMEIIKRKSALI